MGDSRATGLLLVCSWRAAAGQRWLAAGQQSLSGYWEGGASVAAKAMTAGVGSGRGGGTAGQQQLPLTCPPVHLVVLLASWMLRWAVGQ